MVKKQKNIKDITIQETNDSSILSKASITGLGYFHDPYLSLFTTKVPRRAPLIHRGYYIRAKAIDHSLRSFLEHAQSVDNPVQIVSLGAGFDTSYFRLKEQGLLTNCRYVEIDFPDVVRRKQIIIQQHQVLKHLIGDFNINGDSILNAGDYVIVPCDLTDAKKLEGLIGGGRVRFDVPTLFFSECVLTYVKYDLAANLMRWIGEKFEHPCVVNYEQIRPDDAFGNVMMRHFEKVQSQLRRINDLKTVNKHKELFSVLNYEAVVGFDMNYFYTHYVDEVEKDRMMNLEPFDEFEEWHLKCSHYCITAGFKGECRPLSKLMFPNQPLLEDELFLNALEMNETTENVEVTCFGHRCVKLTDNQYLCGGGFGVLPKVGHGRLNVGAVLNVEDGVITKTDITGLNEAMYQGMTRISDFRFFVVGGRLSPKKPITKYGVYEFGRGSVHPVFVQQAQDDNSKVMVSRWRHDAVLLKGKILLFGGMGTDNKVLNDFWSVDPKDLICNKVRVSEALTGRHSHSMCVWRDEKVVLYGGLKQNMQAINELHLITLQDDDKIQTEEIHFDVPLPERYSHTCHVVGDMMYVIGGIEPMGRQQQPLMLLLNLSALTCRMIQMPACNPSRPLMLHNHQSILLAEEGRLLVIGGGGNCFAFGTHFNINVVTFDLNKEIK